MQKTEGKGEKSTLFAEGVLRRGWPVWLPRLSNEFRIAIQKSGFSEAHRRGESGKRLVRKTVTQPKSTWIAVFPPRNILDTTLTAGY